MDADTKPIPGNVGEAVINAIIAGTLFTSECPDSPDSGVLTIWSSGAAEQIEAVVCDWIKRNPTTTLFVSDESSPGGEGPIGTRPAQD